MEKILQLGNKYPFRVLVLLLGISFLALLSLPGLRLEITAEGMMVKDDPARVIYERALDTFGSDNVVVVYVEDKNLFDRDRLLAIQKAVIQLESSPLIDRTVSLFSVRNIHTKDGFTYTQPYLKKIPEDRAELAAIWRSALKNPLIAKNLLSEDGKAMAINIFLDTSNYHRGFDHAVNAEISRIIEPLKKRLDEVFYVGDPYVRVGLTERIKEDQSTIIPLSVFLLVVSLALSLRNIQASIIPLFTAGLSILWTLGLMAILEIPVNVMTSIIPALLIIIGSTEDIHLLTEYRTALENGAGKGSALNTMARNMWLAIILTFTTTYLGFLSISIGSLELLQQFGLIASTGLLFNFIITVLLVPAFVNLVRYRPIKEEEVGAVHIFESVALRVLFITQKYRTLMIALLVSLVLVAGYFSTKVHVNNNVMDYFDNDSQMAMQAEVLHQKLSGIQSFAIVISGTEGTFLQVPYLQELWSLQEFIKDSAYFDSTYSFADFVGVMHSGLNNEEDDLIYLPDRNEVVREYMSLIDQQVARTFVSPDFSQARIIIRHNISSSDELNNAIRVIERHVETWIDPSLKVDVTGENYLNSKAVDYMVRGQFYSLTLILTAIFLIVSILFMNMKAGLLAVFSNLLPIIVLFGVMGLLNIPVNTGTAMVAAISLGVCVDYTMHFMVRFQRLSREQHRLSKPLKDTVREESVPIFSTALALAMGFLTLSFSDFPPVARFGQLSALVMLMALVSTFVLTVIMLQQTRLITVWDILKGGLKRRVLEKCPLFVNMSHWQAKKIIAMSEIREFVQDEAILMQGEEVNYLYVLLDGQVEAWRTRNDGSTYKVGVTDAGGVFGMLFPDSGQQCFADMVALKPARVMVLKWDDLQHIGKSFPRLSSRLFKNLAVIIASILKNLDNRVSNSHDELSGAFGANVFREMLESLVLSANRYDEDLTLICVYFDNAADFMPGRMNFQIGLIGSIIQENLRSSDIYGRWDEKSFWVACPKTSAEEAAHLLGRLESSFASEVVFSKLNTSIHICQASLQIWETAEQFIQRVQLEVGGSEKSVSLPSLLAGDLADKARGSDLMSPTGPTQ